MTTPEAEQTVCDLMLPQEECAVAQSRGNPADQHVPRTSTGDFRHRVPSSSPILPPPGISDDQGILHADTLQNPSRCQSPSFASAIKFV
jgi:hypothetical protein